MKNFLKHWLNEIRQVPHNAPVKEFRRDFPGASVVEWHDQQFGYEARFIQGGKELIAKYSAKGKIIEYHINLSKGSIPDPLVNLCDKWGEVMSLISINKVPVLNYEIIFRKPDHTRFLILTDENGELIEQPWQISPENYPEILPE